MSLRRRRRQNERKDEKEDNNRTAFDPHMPFDCGAADFNTDTEYSGKIRFRSETGAVYVRLAVLAERI